MKRLGPFLLLLLVAFPVAAQLFNIGALKPPETVFDNSLKPWQFTALVPAIAYDNGGSAVGYNSLSQNPACAANGSNYRADYIVGNFKPSTLSPPNPAIPYQICTVVGDWYQYTISSDGAGPFNLTLYTVNPTAGANWAVSIDGAQVATVVAQGNGADWSTVLPATSGQFVLAPGNHFLRITALSGDPIDGLPGDLVQWQGSAVAGPPAPAVAAGFTTPVMKVDFTTVGSTWPANNIVECGASESVSGQPSTWHFHIGGFYGNTLPCARANIVTDTVVGPSGSRQALQIKDLITDHQVNGHEGLTWPHDFSSGTTWMPDAFYAKMVFRWDAQTAYQGGRADNQWWSTTGNSGQSTWVDQNFGETTNGAGQSDGTNTWGGGYWEWVVSYCTNNGNPPCNEFPYYISSPINFSNYHTFEFLWTNDGSANAAMCWWMDGTLQLCGHGSFVNASNYSQHDRVFLFQMGIFGGPLLYDAAEYVQDYEVWSCPSFATGTCAGRVISSWP